MRRVRLLSLGCLLLSCAGLGFLILEGSFPAAALYSFTAIGLLGCAGLFFSGLYGLFLWMGALRCKRH